MKNLPVHIDALPDHQFCSWKNCYINEKEMAVAYQEVENCARRKYNTIHSRMVSNIKNNPDLAEPAAEALVNKCIDEIILDVVAEYHRDIKLGFGHYYYDGSDLDGDDANSAKKRLFEEEPEKKVEDIKCPNCCTRSINASRFAPHLEKCMGMGRNSLRIASRRIANNTKENTYGVPTDDDDDDDWSALSEKMKGTKKIEPKRKRDKPRKQQKGGKGSKEEEQDEPVNFMKLVTMSSEERITFLSNTCAVKIDGQKICLKPLRCSTHSDEERSTLRKMIQESSGQDGFVDIEEVEASHSKPERDNTNSSSVSESSSGAPAVRKRDSKHSRTKKGHSSNDHPPGSSEA